ncbi:hypothetical protein OEA41_001377 [Lepraria neglecta]|uniref:Uncharacterized protein n=1 Tax=Lepraria neglecta TaxID=209136 RepID=A0AAD9ZD52_9LECA|nr:hypothetical protein OEA41_001377 [Lepraria neglecta]
MLATLWINRVSASPHAQLQVPRQPPSLNDLSRPAPEAPLPLNVSASIPSNLSAPFNNILCYNSGHDRQPINIEICRPTLTILRQFPTYRTVQYFKEHKEPRLPNTPPYVINAEDTTCAIEISSRLDDIEDRFSFEQARILATTILEECASRGYGGQSTIGLVRSGWWVKVVGFKEDEPEGNSAGVFGALGIGNTTFEINPISTLATTETS